MATVKAPADAVGKVYNPNLQLVVDKTTAMKFTTFHKHKADILDTISAQLMTMEQLAGKEIQVWSQDNPGENKVLDKNMVNEH